MTLATNSLPIRLYEAPYEFRQLARRLLLWALAECYGAIADEFAAEDRIFEVLESARDNAGGPALRAVRDRKLAAALLSRADANARWDLWFLRLQEAAQLFEIAFAPARPFSLAEKERAA